MAMKSMVVWSAVGLMAVSAWVGVSAQAQKSQWAGVFSAAQAKRGAGLYADKCSSCHGDALNGGDNAPGLIGGEFSANWNDLRLGDLYERIRISMPQDSPGSMSRQEYADVLAFILQRGGYPAGSEDLPSDLAVLNSYQFLANKPQ
jgi:mono/diheme cytochrome c family protein